MENIKFIEKDCRTHFKTKDFYKILGVDQCALESEITRAYRKKARQVHPDRVPEKKKESAKEAFQTLQKLYEILLDEESRLLYDELTQQSSEAFNPTNDHPELPIRNCKLKAWDDMCDELAAKYGRKTEKKMKKKNVQNNRESDVKKKRNLPGVSNEDVQTNKKKRKTQ